MDQLVLLVMMLSNADVKPISKGLGVVAAMTILMVFPPVNRANAILMDRLTLAVPQMGDVHVMLDTLE